MLKFYTCPQNFWTSLENLQKLNWYKKSKNIIIHLAHSSAYAPYRVQSPNTIPLIYSINKSLITDIKNKIKN